MEGSSLRRRGWIPVFLAGVLGAALIAAPAASGAKLAGGATTLALNPGVADALASNGVKVAPIKPATAGAKGVTFPITKGDLDTGKTVRGHVDHSGGLKLSAGGESVALRNFRVVIGKKKAFLAAKAGKATLRVFNLSLDKAKVSSKGLDTVISGVGARLTKAAAAALNGAFETKLFSRGLYVGKVSLRATPLEATLAGGQTGLVPDPAALDAIVAEGITPSAIAPATLGASGFSFPVTGGSVNTKTLAGSITHSGGIRLSDGGTTVDLTDFTIQVDGAPDLTALVGGNRVSILDLDLSQAQTGVAGKRISVTGVKARLTAAAAGALNSAFGTTAFTAGLLLGTASVQADAR
jgi:hypothetical protein